MLFDGGLCPDAGVISSWQPQHFEALHARTARENVLDRVVEDVAKGENAGDIGRRNHNRESWLCGARIRSKIVIFDPARVPLRLDCFWVVRFRKLRHLMKIAPAAAGES